MNGVSCRPLFPRKQTLKLLKLDLQKPCCFHCHHPLFLLSMVQEWCLSYQRLSQGLPFQIPTPDIHWAGHWADINWQAVPSPKDFTISIKKKVDKGWCKRCRQTCLKTKNVSMVEARKEPQSSDFCPGAFITSLHCPSALKPGNSRCCINEL